MLFLSVILERDVYTRINGGEGREREWEGEGEVGVGTFSGFLMVKSTYDYILVNIIFAESFGACCWEKNLF